MGAAENKAVAPELPAAHARVRRAQEHSHEHTKHGETASSNGPSEYMEWMSRPNEPSNAENHRYVCVYMYVFGYVCMYVLAYSQSLVPLSTLVYAHKHKHTHTLSHTHTSMYVCRLPSVVTWHQPKCFLQARPKTEMFRAWIPVTIPNVRSATPSTCSGSLNSKP
jgi:hypothetical protein